MDRILESNERVLRALESASCVDWLSTKKYSECCHAVVLGSLKKKFERPNNTHAENRKVQAIKGIVDRNRSTWTDKRPAPHQVGWQTLNRLVKTQILMRTWFHGATFSLDDAWCGPGESFEPRRGRTAPLDKWTGTLCVTPNALPLAKKFVRRTSYLCDAYRQGEISMKLVQGNRMSTVPKTVEKDRVICMEPELNMALQKALGQTMRRVYRKVTGRSLDDVQGFHRELVRDGIVQVGSDVYNIATVDLSAASDSISMLLCKEVLPPWIYDLVCSTRSPLFQTPDGGWNNWNIVSSMGNGFTFELLSLVTLAACYISGAKFISTYGDDIIVDADSVDSVMETLKHLGFSINVDKTCAHIPQLESCGAFSFDGRGILRYEQTWFENDHDVVVFLNKLYKLTEYYKDDVTIASFTRSLWDKLYKLNHQHLPCGPNHDCEVDGRWVMLPEELYPTKKEIVPSWAQKVCDAYCIQYSDAWVLEALYFEPLYNEVNTPHSPFSYCFVRHRLSAIPTVGVRGQGSWVRKITFVGRSLVMTRSSWNRLGKAVKLGTIIPYPKRTGST